MCVIYTYFHSGKGGFAGGPKFSPVNYWMPDEPMFESECLWIIPGTIDPKDD